MQIFFKRLRKVKRIKANCRKLQCQLRKRRSFDRENFCIKRKYNTRNIVSNYNIAKEFDLNERTVPTR